MRTHPPRSRPGGARLYRLLLVFVVACATAVPTARQQGPGRWVTAWATSQQALGSGVITNTTYRTIARVSASGEAVRLRFDNTFGTESLTVASVHVGVRTRGAALAAASNRKATFAGQGSVSVPPGKTVTTDPIAMRVVAGQDLAISLFVPGTDVRPSQHTNAQVTSYVAAPGAGDVAADPSDTPFQTAVTATWWLKAVDVLSASPGTIVAFGDSITDGTCSTLDARDRWVDWLSVRLILDADNRGMSGLHKALVNEGIGGNTVTGAQLQPPPDSPPGLDRIERDVLSHAGVTDVIVFMGTNDVRRGADAAQVIAGLTEVARRVKARGPRAIGVTMIPRHNRPATADNSGWTPARTAIRNEVNRWMRNGSPFDAVVDFDRVVRDPANPDLINPPFDCGDGIHPSPYGYFEMGRSIPLDLFVRAAQPER